MSRSSERQSLSANQISSTYFNWRLRYYYFRFWKTNVRYFVILLPVLISDLDHFAVICMLFCFLQRLYVVARRQATWHVPLCNLATWLLTRLVLDLNDSRSLTACLLCGSWWLPPQSAPTFSYSHLPPTSHHQRSPTQKMELQESWLG